MVVGTTWSFTPSHNCVDELTIEPCVLERKPLSVHNCMAALTWNTARSRNGNRILDWVRIGTGFLIFAAAASTTAARS